MRQRLVILLATLALLIAGAVPAMAAPGGVPGPPDGHGKKGNDGVVEEADEAEEDDSKLPAWAWAHGKRIKDATGLTFGHLKQCADDDKASELCDELDFDLPDEFTGASEFAMAMGFAIWHVTDEEVLVLGL